MLKDREERERQRRIAAGVELETLDTIPADTGAAFVLELKEAWAVGDRKTILSVLKRIGDTIHARWGNTLPVHPYFDDGMNKYLVNLSSGTSGTRLMINMAGNYPGDLIFPSVHLGHNIKGRTLAEVFEELFGDSATNIQADEKEPYYVVKIASADKK